MVKGYSLSLYIQMMDEGAASKTNWSKCRLCQQEKSNATLISPLSSCQRKQDYAGYSNIARNVPLFHAINDMPIAFNPSRIDEGEDIEMGITVADCCSRTPERARQRRAVPSTSGSMDEPRSKRRKSAGIPKVECFFCEDDISNLQKGMAWETTPQSMCQNSE